MVEPDIDEESHCLDIAFAPPARSSELPRDTSSLDTFTAGASYSQVLKLLHSVKMTITVFQKCSDYTPWIFEHGKLTKFEKK